MATGDTKLSICSDALIMLGASPLSSFSEGSDAAQICDRLYDDIKSTLTVMYPWGFSQKKVQLARLSDAPASEWEHAYALPADNIGSGVVALFTSSAAGSRPVADGWEIYERNVLTNFTEVHVDYQANVSEGVMPSYFVQLLKYWMAWHIAETVTDQITKAQYYQLQACGNPSENMRGGMFRVCCQIDGGAKPPQTIEDFDLISTRLS
jgi:hypothetical protein